MENVLFKISYPGRVPRADRGGMRDAAASAGARAGIDEIERIVIETQEAGVRIIDKTGPLANYADRDHCLQYMVAVPLIFGRLTADDYSDDVAADPRIDALRAQDGGHGEPAVHRRTISIPTSATSATRCRCSSRTARSTDKVSIDYPIGHRKRRAEGIPVLMAKFEAAIAGHLPAAQADRIMALAGEPGTTRSHAHHRVHESCTAV